MSWLLLPNPTDLKVERNINPPTSEGRSRTHRIPVYQPERMRDPAVSEAIDAYEPDLIVTAAYGQILPKSVLLFLD